MKKSFSIKTYGCQANKADSERIAGFLEKKGYKEALSIKEADLIIINSCSVRQTAEDRIGGLVRNLILQRKKTMKQNKVRFMALNRPKVWFRAGKPKKIILTGCALYHGVPWLKKRFKDTDEFIPTSRLTDPMILPKRKDETNAWVPIIEGCSHFCSYCVVPYARGKEVSRPFEEIVCEVKELTRRGYKEITLLGQNVNSYGKDFPEKERKRLLKKSGDSNYWTEKKSVFALLLQTIHRIKGIKKISFITSNPWDLTDDIIEAMSLPKINRHLHLPVQSGDNEILQRMNRPYTAQDYIKLIKKIRNKIPDIKIGTDIIVGFPKESEKQFQNTIELCKKVGFEKAYIAIYSPRPGTAAYKFKDNVPYKEKKRRWRILDGLINKNQNYQKILTQRFYNCKA